MKKDRFYAQKGYSVTDAELFGAAATMMKMGLLVMVGKEKSGSTARKYIEIYETVEFGQEKAAPSVTSTESGGAEENISMAKIPQEGGIVNGEP